MKKHRMRFFEADDGGGSGGGGGQPGGDGTGTLIPAGGGAPGGAAGDGSPVPFFGADGNFVEGWADKLPADFIPADELPAFKLHASKYKSPLDAVKSDFHKEKLIGKKGVVVPTDKSTPEEVSAFRKALGVPDKPEGYQLKPAELPEGLTWSDDLAKPFADIAHKHNIPPGAMNEIIGQYVAMQKLTAEETGRMFQAELDKGMQTLKDTWKNETEKNLGLSARVAKTIGLDPTSPGLRDPNVVIALQRVGKMLSEDKMIAGDVSATMQPGKARANDIMTNPANPQFKDYQGENGPDRQREAAALVSDLLANG